MLRAWGLALVLALLCPVLQSRAATEQEGPSRSKRWLVVMEASSVMQRKKDGAAEVLDALLESRMNGQLTDGDTVGFWALGRELRTGLVPLQHWSAQEASRVAAKSMEFVSSQTFEGTADYAALATALTNIVQDSPLLTVILLSSGSERFQGTPFEAKINSEWSDLRDDRSRKPIVTVFRVVKGTLADFAITPGDFEVDIPKLPKAPKPKPASAPQKSPSTALTLTNKPVVAPLIFSGPKKSPAPETNAIPQDASSTRAVPALTNKTAAAIPTNSPAGEATNLPAALRPSLVETQSASGTAGAVAASTNLATSEPAATNEPLAERAPANVVPKNSAPEQPVTAEQPRGVAWKWIVGGATVLVLAAIGIVLSRKRKRHVSLITESIDRDQR